MAVSSRRLLVLDLDETLVYATMFSLAQQADFRVGLAQGVKRPGVDAFLSACLDRFAVGIWTSATRGYAEDVLRCLLNDTDRLAFVWARERCVKMANPKTQEQFWRKDLTELGRAGFALDSIIVVDDTPESWLKSSLIYFYRF